MQMSSEFYTYVYKVSQTKSEIEITQEIWKPFSEYWRCNFKIPA